MVAFGPNWRPISMLFQRKEPIGWAHFLVTFWSLFCGFFHKIWPAFCKNSCNFLNFLWDHRGTFSEPFWTVFCCILSFFWCNFDLAKNQDTKTRVQCALPGVRRLEQEKTNEKQSISSGGRGERAEVENFCSLAPAGRASSRCFYYINLYQLTGGG